jgi:hypothetical protein
MKKTVNFVVVLAIIFGGLYSILLVVAPRIIAESTLKARTGETLATVQDPGAGEALVVQTRHLGVFALCITIALFFILFNSFKNAERWAWWAFLIIGIIVWGYGLFMQISEKDMLNMILHLVGVVLWFVGIFIPYKLFFAKKSA